MNTTTAVAERPTQQLSPHQQNIKSLRQLAESPAYINRFKQVLNDRAPQFLASLVQLVSGSEYLAKCDPNSIMAAAITSAALDLPIDKNLGFAHIVPYGNVAQFQMGYKGFIQLAIRTGQYRLLNCCVVYDGELVKHDEMTAEVILDPSKRATPLKVVGYAAYFKLVNGFEHAEYWSKEEMNEHALTYSQAYKKGRETPWKTNFDTMGLKTVIKSLLSHWGIMSIEMQKALTSDQGVRKSIDSDEVAYPDNDVKRPLLEGPDEGEGSDLGPETQEQKEAKAAAAAKSANVIDQGAIPNPCEHLMKLIQETEGCTFPKAVAYFKTVKMLSEKSEEIIQMKDSDARIAIQGWKSVSKAISRMIEPQA